MLQIQIRTDDMELAAELVQDIAAFLGVLEMDCLADFPAEMEQFGRVLDKVCPSAAVCAGWQVRDRIQRRSLQLRLHLQHPAQCCLSQLWSAAAPSIDTACHAKRQRAHPTLQVQEHNATRIKMTAEMADSSNIVKALIVKLSPAACMSTPPHAGCSCLLHAALLPSTSSAGWSCRCFLNPVMSSRMPVPAG